MAQDTTQLQAFVIKLMNSWVYQQQAISQSDEWQILPSAQKDRT